jgi:hypothetical protein
MSDQKFVIDVGLSKPQRLRKSKGLLAKQRSAVRRKTDVLDVYRFVIWDVFRTISAIERPGHVGM